MEKFTIISKLSSNSNTYNEKLYYRTGFFDNEPIIYNKTLGQYMFYNIKTDNREMASRFSDSVGRSNNVDDLKIKEIFTDEMMQKYRDNQFLQTCRDDREYRRKKSLEEEKQKQKSDQLSQSENLKSQL
ncbi:hypothetical protein AGMMS50249_4460 [candidate division SR1 bacterium]|nr:hypothetical protein AGMMS50249_4460 [candidate division SR1 bacterium]